ncbi:MAG: hypothetical protein QM811_01630 [Pirellulales bacterium]
MPDGGRTATGQLDSDGRFTLTTYQIGDGCLIGAHPVEIIALEVLGPGRQRWHTPAKYRDYAKSGLIAKVDGPTDDLAFELTWEGTGREGPYLDDFKAAATE